jgi:hypothetical protein
MKRHVLFAAWLAMLQGCATEPASQIPAARPPDLTPIEATGDYTHVPSRALIPAEMAGFRRVSLFRRGPDGQRLTVSYAGGTPECTTAITLFLDPADPPDSVDKAYATAKDEVTQAYPSATLEREESRDDPALKGKRALFLIDYRRMEVGVVLAQKAWYVKHRVIFPAQCTAAVNNSLNGFFPGWAH